MRRGLHAELAHALTQLPEAIAQLALAVAEAGLLALRLALALTRLLALLATLILLTLLTLLPLLATLALALLALSLLALPLLAALTLLAALPLLALLSLLSLLSLLALLALLAGLVAIGIALLLAERVVEKLLLFADDVPELVHHLHHLLALLALALALRHAPVLQLLQHIAELAEHLLRHVARALPRHVFDVAHHPLEVLLADGLVVLILPHLRRRLAFGLAGELLHELVQG